jgi:outer membrane protein OmpA-like peptidoglycan-associated protein
VNLKLSLQRAQAVKDYLSSHGFPDVPMNAQGKGELDPIRTEADCAGADQVACLGVNRRVHVILNR